MKSSNALGILALEGMLVYEKFWYEKFDAHIIFFPQLLAGAAWKINVDIIVGKKD
jgi:hypothetical protein